MEFFLIDSRVFRSGRRNYTGINSLPKVFLLSLCLAFFKVFCVVSEWILRIWLRTWLHYSEFEVKCFLFGLVAVP